MKPSTILQNTFHRSHPLPAKNWQWYQEWNDVVFIHGSADVDLLRPFVAPHLTIDTFEGKAWISLVIFKMENIRHRFTPSFPPLSDFHEVNIRTYVTDGEMPGVYFFSMEASKRLSAFLAKKLSGLPYWYVPMECKNGVFRSEHYSYEYKPGADVTRDELADWLTERYAVYFIKKGFLARYQVHHDRWPLKEVAIENLATNTSLNSGLVNWKPELFHYSPGVQVLAWPVEKL